jgi:hypothetical protein
VGWEQNVQHANASASPSQGSSSGSSPHPDHNASANATYADAVEVPLCHIEDGPQGQASSAQSQLGGARGFLNVVRHGSGPNALYVVTYRRIDHNLTTKPVLAEGASLLIELLERLGVSLHLSEVREALEDVHRLGSANIPDLWLSEEQMTERGLSED